jgi:CarD family transcriptional regulator
VVENISCRVFAGHQERYYLLKLASTAMTVMVPFSHVGGLRLRKVTRTSEMTRVLEFLAKARARKTSDWKDRFKENSDKMADGTPMKVAEVLRCLLEQQAAAKVLSFREKKMLDRARHMLITEMCTSRGVSEAEAIAMFDKALGKVGLKFPEPM